MFLRALQEYGEALGSKHTSTLQTVNNLSLLYADQGKLKEAKTMYETVCIGTKSMIIA
jgi:Tetratricopeptide repeat